MKEVSRIVKGDKEIIRYENGRVRVRAVNKGKCMAQQQFRDSQDINIIMKKYNNQMANIPDFSGEYADLTTFKFEDEMNKISRAEEAFAGLPSEIRTRFDNRPGKLLQFLDDPNNYDEAVKMKLVTPKSKPAPSDTDRIISALGEVRETLKPTKKKTEE